MGNFCSDCGSTTTKASSDYGDVTNIVITGASRKTAQQYNLTDSGIKASHTMAEIDWHKWKETTNKDVIAIIKNVADQKKIKPALTAAIFSRESRAENTLKKDQDDSNPWDSEEHVSQQMETLVACIEDIGKTFPRWKEKQRLIGGIAAYNVGVEKVEKGRSYERVDEYTTNGDYSNDVVARAQWYKSMGGF